MSHVEEFEVTIPSATQDGMRVQRQILDRLQALAFSKDDIFSVRLATEEALVNAIKHGNGANPDKTIRIAWWIGPQHVRVEIEDQGDGFDLQSVPDPCLRENLERPSGRGIMLMRRYMSSVEFLDSGKRLVLEKHRSPDSRAGRA